jgi:prepilin signal peptidase PulO-like enzyme (type II secretory pathway)
VIEAIVLALGSGAVVSLALLITKVSSLTDYVPHGPLMVAGAMIRILWGYGVAEWFLP